MLPVVDDHGQVRGMITDRDICMAAWTTGQSLAGLQVREAMAIEVVSVRPHETLHEAEMLMRRHQVRRLPVIGDQGKLIGMLTCNDLVNWVDDAGTTGRSHHDAVHLVRTLAAVGQSRHGEETRRFEPVPAPDGAMPGWRYEPRRVEPKRSGVLAVVGEPLDTSLRLPI